MLTRTEAQRAMAALLGFSYHKIKLIGEQLAKDGLIESKGRGRYGLPLNPKSCTVLFLAVCGSETNTDAPRAVKELLSCVSNHADGSIPVNKYLEKIFSDPILSSKINGVDVCRTIPEVRIDDMWFAPAEYWDSEKHPRKPGGVIWAYISGEVIHQLAISLNAPDPGDPGHD
jgi:hypothetical protein